MVATDAKLSKAQCNRLAVMAQDGLARAIYPVHTPLDGDIVFAAALGQKDLPDPVFALSELGMLAGNVVARAISRGVYEATALSFPNALRAALREDPDYILVGEMRDLETTMLAIEAANTGHLVLSTMHTMGATRTIDRIVDMFPADQQSQIRTSLSESLKGVMSQALFKRMDKPGRIAALEILLVTPAAANLIREQKTYQLMTVIQTGRRMGMISLDDAIADLLQRRLISPEEAFEKAAEKAGAKPMARIVAQATSGVEPKWVMMAPVAAVQSLLKKIGWKGFAEGKDSGVYRVAPLARLNASDGMATPLAQAEYEKMYSVLGGKPVHNTLAFHWARLIEAQYAAERMLQLLSDKEITDERK